MSGRKYFGTDGVRGIVPSDLTPEFVLKLAAAASSYFGLSGKTVVIGTDTRISSDTIKSALISGLTASGANVLDVGVVPTPAVSYLTRALSAKAGVVVSASHNPYEYNGIKFFDENGYKLSDEAEISIEEIFDGQTFSFAAPDFVGKWIVLKDAATKYTDHIAEAINNTFNGLKVGVDCANGAVSESALLLFEKLGIDAEFICAEPNGKNINLDCGATNTAKLRELVREKRLNGGIAFDGDGDRIIFIDENGIEINGDHLIAFLSIFLKEEGKLKNDCVIATVLSNMGLEKFLERNGINLVRSDVGDRYVLEAMILEGAVIGGEQSGHIIIFDDTRTGDGLYVAAVVLEALARKKKRLSEIRMFDMYPQVQRNVKVANKDNIYINDKINASIRKAKETLGESGRVIVRLSGTEPVVRVMVEAKDVALSEKIAEDLAKNIQENLPL